MDLKLAVAQKIEFCFVTAEDHFGQKIPRPKLSFDIRGQDAGRAYYEAGFRASRDTKIKFNEILLYQNPDEYLENIVAHECAHLIVNAVFGARVKPHGKEWKSVMSGLFNVNPTVMHSLDVSDIAPKPYIYSCQCPSKEIHIGKRQHNNIQKGGEYICRSCKAELKYFREEKIERKKDIVDKTINRLYLYAQKDISQKDMFDRIDYVLNKQKPEKLILLEEAHQNQLVQNWVKKKRLKSRSEKGESLFRLSGQVLEDSHFLALVKQLNESEKNCFDQLVSQGARLRVIKC